MKKVDPKVDEAIQTLNMKDGPSRRKLLAGTGLVSATAAASALLAACSSSNNSSTGTVRCRRRPPTRSRATSRGSRVAVLVRQPRHHQPFFVPTQFGFADAAALLGMPKPKWGGSTDIRGHAQHGHRHQHRRRREGGRHRDLRHQQLSHGHSPSRPR